MPTHIVKTSLLFAYVYLILAPTRTTGFFLLSIVRGRFEVWVCLTIFTAVTEKMYWVLKLMCLRMLLRLTFLVELGRLARKLFISLRPAAVGSVLFEISADHETPSGLPQCPLRTFKRKYILPQGPASIRTATG